MKISNQKFMLRQLRKEYLQFLASYLGGDVHGDSVLVEADNVKEHPTFEMWLEKNQLLEDE